MSTMVTFDEDKQKQRTTEFRKKEEEEVAEILSQKYGLEYVDLSRIAINNDALRLLSEEESRAANIGLFNIVDKRLSLGLLSTTNEKTLEAIKKLEERG